MAYETPALTLIGAAQNIVLDKCHQAGDSDVKDTCEVIDSQRSTNVSLW